ncbi:MAG TPA: helix-turn-helix domain-containing protein [Bryobacteraceae bacterium]|nr:helix-turn-helix domain-containing protein [Bryobacteraceae bacterium]
MEDDQSRQAYRLSAVLLDSLNRASGVDELARRAYQSRSGFFRLFAALIDETPGGMRRRLLLERAAWQLRDTPKSVTEIALDAGYGSLEAFTRAFRKAFRVSPSIYRRCRMARIHLPAPNHFHFRPRESGPEKPGRTNMDLFDLFAGTESWYTRRMLEHAGKLNDEQLDRPVKGTMKLFGWCEPDKSVREILERIVQTKEAWTAAITGGEMPVWDVPKEGRTPQALLARFEKVEAAFHSALSQIRDRGAWDEPFVDALCEPPETFTFGGMFAHVITFNSARRLAALDAFQQLGVPMEGMGCPMEYEASMGVGPVRHGA